MNHLRVIGDYAYVGGSNTDPNFRIINAVVGPTASPFNCVIDVTNPLMPAQGRVGPNNVNWTNSFAMTVAGDFAYVASGEHGLRILELKLPKLRFQLTGSQLVLSWSFGGVGHQLQMSDSLAGSAQWNGVPYASIQYGDGFQVTMDIPQTNAFFRLIKPL